MLSLEICDFWLISIFKPLIVSGRGDVDLYMWVKHVWWLHFAFWADTWPSWCDGTSQCKCSVKVDRSLSCRANFGSVLGSEACSVLSTVSHSLSANVRSNLTTFRFAEINRVPDVVVRCLLGSLLISQSSDVRSDVWTVLSDAVFTLIQVVSRVLSHLRKFEFLFHVLDRFLTCGARNWTWYHLGSGVSCEIGPSCRRSGGRFDGPYARGPILW